MKKPYEIPSILHSLAADLADEVITLEDAAAELCRAGYMNYIDEDKAARLLRAAEKED